MLGMDEAALDRPVKEHEERIEESFDVEYRARFFVDRKLRPREGFHELLESPVSAGQSDEPVGEVGHELLSFVHRADDFEIGESFVADLLLEEGFRHDADDFRRHSWTVPWQTSRVSVR